MATIRKRGSRYQVQVRRKGQTAISRSFLKRGDAEEWARHMEVLADRRALPASVRSLEGIRLRDLLLRYREEISPRKKSFENEKYLLNQLLRHPVSNRQLTDLSPTIGHEYREERLAVVKPGTVNRELSLIQHVLEVAINQWGVQLVENPLKKLKRLRVQNARTRRLLSEELDALIIAARRTQNPHLLPLILLAIETGMRRGELLATRWKEINFANRTLVISVSKNGHSRTIPLSSRAVEILEQQKERKWDTEVVFPITANATRLAWERLLQRANITDLHFHDLRHEAISRLFERGLAVPEVALISGHRDFRMLFRYTHLNPKELVEKLR